MRARILWTLDKYIIYVYVLVYTGIYINSSLSLCARWVHVQYIFPVISRFDVLCAYQALCIWPNHTRSKLQNTSTFSVGSKFNMYNAMHNIAYTYSLYSPAPSASTSSARSAFSFVCVCIVYVCAVGMNVFHCEYRRLLSTWTTVLTPNARQDGTNYTFIL